MYEGLKKNRGVVSPWSLVSVVCLVGPLLAEAVDGRCASTSPTGTASSWPIYHGDAGLRGIAACKLPDKLLILWRHKVGVAVTLAPVSDGKRIYVVAENGEAHAISLNGGKIWSALIGNEPAGTNAIRQVEKYSTPPIVVRDTLFIGSDMGYLHALDSDTGKGKWKYQVGESMISTANWIEPEGSRGASVVVISQSDGVLHRVDFETGRRIWASPPVSRCDGSPGVGSDFIVFGSCDAALHVFSAARGELTGTIALEGDGQVAGGTAVEGTLVFAGTRGGQAVCADVKKLAIVWTNQICDSETFSTPAVTSDRIVTCANDGKVYCLNRVDGKILWSFKVGGDPHSPVIAGDKVVVSSGGTLYVLKLEDGSKLWSDKPGDSISPPAVFGGRIVVGTDDGFVLMYGAEK